jgi:uncharacterized protein YjeT (DUF2065 family)
MSLQKNRGLAAPVVFPRQTAEAVVGLEGEGEHQLRLPGVGAVFAFAAGHIG